jgi:hypothetical protein
MSEETGPNLPPFPSSYRASGLLLHVTSLPRPTALATWDRLLCHDTEPNCFSSRFQRHITRPGQSTMGSIR